MKQIRNGLIAGILMASLFDAFLFCGEGKISGRIYADYYYMLSNHNSFIEGMNGFWFRRLYLSYKYKFSSSLKAKVRFEANSKGDFVTKEKIYPYVKDLYLEWKRGKQAVIIGISSTPTFNKIEKVWEYRAVEKTPLDLYKMGHSRGTGIAFKGYFSKGKVYYHVMFANGEGNKSENNKQKKVMAALGFSPSQEFYLEVYGDYEAGPAPATGAYTLQGFASVNTEKFAAGVQYSEKTYQGEEEIKLRVASAFLRFKAGKRLAILGRVDRMMDPNPYGPSISYLPLDSTSPFTLAILGADYKLCEHISIIPNVEFVSYDEVNDNDFIGKVTLYYRW